MECNLCELEAFSKDAVVQGFCGTCRGGAIRETFCIIYSLDGRTWKPFLATSDPEVAENAPALIDDPRVESGVLAWDSERRAYRKLPH